MTLLNNTQMPARQVTITTSGRLHMGFYNLCQADMANSTHKIFGSFGSLGLTIDTPITQITIAKNKNTVIDAKSNQNAIKIVEMLVKALNIKMHFTLQVNEMIPAHVGLGSGTQMALAIGAGLNALFDLNLSVPQIAVAANRGNRSGIGIAAFMQGGMLLDAGKVNCSVPQLAMRQDFPKSWRILLIADSTHVGVHDEAELQAFNTLKPAQNTLQNMVFNHMMPALQRADLLSFGAYMQDLQAYNGEYFAPIQGGHFASQDVAQVLSWLQANGAACVGQSSWGPTGFALFDNQQHAEALQMQAKLAFTNKSNITFQIARGKNTGAQITFD